MLKILEVFTKEYKEETKYYEMQQKMINKIKLQDNNYNVNEVVNRLADYQSNCSIVIGISNL